jgi:hypothetical protein
MLYSKMQNHQVSNGSLTSAVSANKYRYSYPLKNDLRPGSKLHNLIRDEILYRARRSVSALEPRYTSWVAVDKMLRAYIQPNNEERKVLARDPEKPISIVVPSLYAMLETFLTYNVDALITNPQFAYQASGPEDVIGTMLLQRHIHNQSMRAKMPLALYQQWRSDFAYGFGAVALRWQVQERQTFKRVEENDYSSFDMAFNDSPDIQRTSTKQTQTVTIEGNVLDYIPAYYYLPDPDVPISDVQKGEYVGWLHVDSFNNLYNDEVSTKSLFNIQYLQHVGGRTRIFSALDEEIRTLTSPDSLTGYGPRKDCVFMYIKIIPAEWGLGNKQVPETWLFGLAGDEVVIQATPINLSHSMFPVSVTCTEVDGKAMSATSKLERFYGLQKVSNWFINSHIRNVRKTMNEMLVVDPSIVNMEDLFDDRDGKIIRMKPSIYNKTVADAIKQLPVSDVTRNHMGDAGMFLNTINNLSGAVDMAQGKLRSHTGDISATEASGTLNSALSKLAKSARLAHMTGMHDLAIMCALHTQQFMTNESYLKLDVGEWESVLQTVYDKVEKGADGNYYVYTSPADLLVGFDVIPSFGIAPAGYNGQALMQLYQLILQDPNAYQQYDTTRIIADIAQSLGYPNMIEMIRKNQPINTQVAEEEEIENEVDKGNLIPLNAGGL